MSKGRTPTGLVALALALTLASAALATPEIQGQFGKMAKVKPGSALATAQTQCRSCHVKMGEKALNPFGADMKGEMGKQKTKALTPAVWQKLAARDSDHDKKNNKIEVAAGTLPGDPKSKP
jgi:hypothetical protein